MNGEEATSVLGSEAEALAAAVAYQEAGAAAVEAWRATQPVITAEMLGQSVPGTTIPIYTLAEAQNINPPPSETGLRMGPSGVTEAFVNVLPEVITPTPTPTPTVVQVVGGGTPTPLQRSMIPIPPVAPVVTVNGVGGEGGGLEAGASALLELLKQIIGQGGDITQVFQQGGFQAFLPYIPAALRLVGGMFGGGVGAALATLATLSGVGLGAYKLLDGGEPPMTNGGTGVVATGGNIVIGGVLLSGPGLKEPPPAMIAKHWRQKFETTGHADAWLECWVLIDGRRLTYNFQTRRYRLWRPYKNVVIGKRLPAHKTIFRLRKFLGKHTSDAKTILRITSPNSLRAPVHHYHRRYHKRRN